MASDTAKLRQGFAALRQDLMHDGGPRISTMRNYRFAIMQYEPQDEFELRAEVQSLHTALVAHGWHILTIDLQALLYARIRALGQAWLDSQQEIEAQLLQYDLTTALDYLKDSLSPLVDGPDGLASDCSDLICHYADAHPDRVDSTLAVIGGAGAVYPFFRSSALLRHLDGKTRNVPVLLLYPGSRRGDTGLSFMGVLQADHDYRPRIYP